MCLEMDYKTVFSVLVIGKLHVNMCTDLKEIQGSLLLSLRLSHSGLRGSCLPSWPGHPDDCPRRLSRHPLRTAFSSWPHLTSQPPDKPECGEGRENGDVPTPGTAKVANEGVNGGPCPGKHPSDRVSGWAPWNVRTPNGLQTFFSARPGPLPTTKSSKPVAGGRGRCSQSRSGSTGSAQGHTRHAEQLPLHTHSHRGTRQPHRLDAFPSPNLSLLIHKMGRYSRPS